MSEYVHTDEAGFPEGLGTGAHSFLQKVGLKLPDLHAGEASRVVCQVLLERLSGGLADEVVDELPPDVRGLIGYQPDPHRPAPAGHKAEFYREISERLNVDPADVRRILFAVFYALHSQLTESVANKVRSELPPELSSTWAAAHRGVQKPS